MPSCSAQKTLHQGCNNCGVLTPICLYIGGLLAEDRDPRKGMGVGSGGGGGRNIPDATLSPPE